MYGNRGRIAVAVGWQGAGYEPGKRVAIVVGEQDGEIWAQKTNRNCCGQVGILSVESGDELRRQEGW